MVRPKARCALLALALTVPLLTSACGSSSSSGNGEAKKTGPQVAKDAGAALGASNAVHISGQVTESSTKKQIGVDLQVQSDGTSGTLTYSGQPVSLVVVDGTSYVKAPAAFYESQGASPAQAAKVADRWVKTANSKDFDNFTLASLSKSLGEPSDGSKINDKVTTDTISGQDVVVASENDGSKLYVAATGKPVPLQVTNSAQSKDGVGTLTFTDYGKHQTIKTPADAIDAGASGA